mmetsp:Transcript_3634/g.5419  ORF Transcript_3634/g.5419 Transcript_3634/m.5419 type:complete len:241 (+) Transcript_3634:187-909(+)
MTDASRCGITASCSSKQLMENVTSKPATQNAACNICCLSVRTPPSSTTKPLSEEKIGTRFVFDSENVDTSNFSAKISGSIYDKKAQINDDEVKRKIPLKGIHHELLVRTVHPAENILVDDEDDEELASIFANAQQQLPCDDILSKERLSSTPSGRRNPAIPTEETNFTLAEESMSVSLNEKEHLMPSVLNELSSQKISHHGLGLELNDRNRMTFIRPFDECSPTSIADPILSLSTRISYR